MPRSSSMLTKEQRIALSVLQKHYSQIHQLIRLSKTLQKDQPLLRTNFVHASHHNISPAELPRESDWCWNQSNAKIRMELSPAVTVTMRKISPRNRNTKYHPILLPQFKVWIFAIESLTSPDIHFLWVEKGVDTSVPVETMQEFCGGIETPIGTVHPERLSLHSLSFLVSFIDNKVAAELGWL